MSAEPRWLSNQHWGFAAWVRGPKDFFFDQVVWGSIYVHFLFILAAGTPFFVLTKMLKICAKYVPKIKSGNTLMSNFSTLPLQFDCISITFRLHIDIAL